MAAREPAVLAAERARAVRHVDAAVDRARRTVRCGTERDGTHEEAAVVRLGRHSGAGRAGRAARARYEHDSAAPLMVLGGIFRRHQPTDSMFDADYFRKTLSQDVSAMG